MGGFHEVETTDFSMKHQSGGFDEPTWGGNGNFILANVGLCVVFSRT